MLLVLSNMTKIPPNSLPSQVSNLVLTSSFDWSVKLWNPKLKNECLCSFESAEDYVYDVCWNRANPCLFTSVDGEGYIDLWDLSQDLEIPIIHQKAGTQSWKGEKRG